MCVAALGSCAIYGGVVHAFAPPSQVCPTRYSTLQLGSSPEPLATEGDWSAYVDAETTGYIYYFNSVTGESSWDPPSSTFPAVAAPSAEDTTREQRKEQRRLERKQAREQRKRERDERRMEREAKEAKEREARKLERAEKAAEPVADAVEGQTKKKSSGGGFFGFFAKGSSDKTDDGKPKKTKLETLNELSDMATNDGFLSELDAVIAEGRFSFDHCLKWLASPLASHPPFTAASVILPPACAQKPRVGFGPTVARKFLASPLTYTSFITEYDRDRGYRYCR